MPGCLLVRLFLDIDSPFDHVLKGRAMREQVELLKHHRYLLADQDDRLVAGVYRDPVNADLATVVTFQPVDAAKDG